MERPISTTLGSLLDEITAIQPNNPALIFNGQCYTFAEFQYQVNLFARGLLQIGVRKGTHVAILMSNRPEWLFVDFACAKIGASVPPDVASMAIRPDRLNSGRSGIGQALQVLVEGFLGHN